MCFLQQVIRAVSSTGNHFPGWSNGGFNPSLTAVAAITQAGKTGQIAVVGFDNISAIQQLIKEGGVLATADQHADLLAVYGIEYALQALNSGTALEDRNTPVDLITFDSFE